MIPNKFRALVEAPYICARIVAHDRNSYQIRNEQGEFRAEVSGSFRHDSNDDPSAFPVVGDYVHVSIKYGAAIINSVLQRQNLFARRAVFGAHTLQPIAANIDRLFLVMAVNRDFNARRLERYLVAASAYGVPCAIVLNKIDLADDPTAYVAEAQETAGEHVVLPVSALNRNGLEALTDYRGEEQTIAFVGSSGVGKSTLSNALLGNEQLATGGIRADDDRGRHTTTRRCIFYLSDGTAVIDTPGMREFGLADAAIGVSQTFSEVEAFAQSCKFRDCKHVHEPGCAVKESVDSERLQSWRKLEKEAAFEARKTDRALAEADKKKWIAVRKEARQRQR